LWGSRVDASGELAALRGYLTVMLRNASLFLGLRYLRPRRSFVSIITLISICGVMLGVAVMVIVMSIFKGWQVEFRQMLLGFEPHVMVSQEPPYEGAEVSDWRTVQALAEKQPGVISAMPVALGIVVLDAGGELEAMEVMGFRPEAAEGLMGRLQKHLKEGEFNLNEDTILLTDKMAAKLGVKLGDVLTVNSAQNIQHMVNSLEKLEDEKDEAVRDAAYEEAYIIGSDVTVAGILRGDTAGDRGYLPLHLAQELFGLEDRVTGINLELTHPEAAPEVAMALEMSEELPGDWYAGTWQDGAAQMLQSVENQQSLLYFLLLFIILVAAICVMNTTITVTVQKRREIGILTALGTRRGQVVGIFLTQALMVAVLGVGLGVALGAVVLAYRNDARTWIAEMTGRDFFPQEIYFLSSIPSKMVAADLVSICGMALVLCVLAALIPAWVAARVDPAVALRD
jgi:lipoprotein-releasing system permease protein